MASNATNPSVHLTHLISKMVKTITMKSLSVSNVINTFMYKLKLSKDGGKRGFHSTLEEEEKGNGTDEEEG